MATILWLYLLYSKQHTVIWSVNVRVNPCAKPLNPVDQLQFKIRF